MTIKIANIFCCFKRALITLLLICIIIIRVSAQSDDSKKASYIFNILPSVEWANEDTIKVYTLGVFSSSSMFKELTLLSKSSSLKNKNVRIIHFKKLKDIKPTHILFVSTEEIYYSEIVFNKIKDKNTLLITENFTNNQFIMINLLSMEDNKKHFEINLKNAENEGLKFSKMIIKQGGNEGDLKNLYSLTERELQDEKKKLEKQAKDLEEKKKEIEAQKADITKKEKELVFTKAELKVQKGKLDTMIQEVENQRETVRRNMEILNRQEVKIKLQDKNYQSQEQKRKDIKLEVEKLELKTKKVNKELAEKEEKLGESNATIENQKSVIFAFIGFIGIIILLAFLVLFGYIRKQKTNKQLKLQNIAINKQKEEITMQSEQMELFNVELEKLSIVASKTDNAVTIMDSKGNFEWVNPGFTRLYGYTLQLLTHERDENIVGVSKNTDIKDIINKCINGKETVIYENLSETRQGNQIWVQTTLTPILNPDGDVIKLVSIDTDISKVKLAEQEIRSQHKMIVEQSKELEKKNHELEKLSLVASETDNAILIMDETGNFIWVNDAFTRMFGFTFDHLVTNISKNIVGPETSSYIKKLINHCITNKKTVDYEFKAFTNNQQTIWIHTTLTPIIDKSGKIKNLVAIDTDVTKIKQAEIEIRQQSEELMAQKEELKHQNEKIELQNSHIRASISYAKNIQSAILPTKKDMNQFFSTFVIFRPKDVVSGDFYWFAHMPAKGDYSEKIFMATIDCTGHGVPGAFMSMIGSRLLNEIVMENKIVTPKDILSTLNTKVIEALRQSQSENNDGMDVCLCRLEKMADSSILVKYSGAKRPLYYHRKGAAEVEKLEADRKSIGGVRSKRSKIEYTNQELVLNKDDMMWLTTDGIVDQNSIERKRFGSPRFQSILMKVAEMSLADQKLHIEKELDQYMIGAEQRDDITVFGIKI